MDALRTGAGVGWQAHGDRLFSGVLRLFRPGYAVHLVRHWLPALDGVVDKLQAGERVADVGRGLGASTIRLHTRHGRPGGGGPAHPAGAGPHRGGQAMTVAPIAASAASPRARSAPPMITSVRAH